MAETLRPDICVIGGGPGGLSIAAAAAAFGVPIVLIESHKMGGDSLNAGCVPSKALLAAARRAEATWSAKLFGVDVRDTIVNFSGVHRHIHSVIAAVAPPIQSNVSPGSAFESFTRRRSSRTATQSLPAISRSVPAAS